MEVAARQGQGVAGDRVMKRYLEDTIIAWLRSQPAFTNRTRFDLELLIGDLVRDVANELEQDDREAYDEGYADGKFDAEFEAEFEAAGRRAAAKEAKRKSTNSRTEVGA